MNVRKILTRCPSIAIALVPILVLAALIAALAISLAPDESAPVASEPIAPRSTELMDPADPDAPELADIGYEKSQDGIRDVATFFFDLLDYETINSVTANFAPIVAGPCKAEECWKVFHEKEDLTTSPDDIQIGGYHYLYTNYTVQFDSNKAYLVGELLLSRRSVLTPTQGIIEVEEELDEITMDFEYTANGWKITGFTLEDAAKDDSLS
ncbi:hypothetical protein [Glutamicibacter arilaitensis]|uniref:hypothetical protein n=1 Tax=Glutamicibacter arilaitensis TaxID=256701 RepID=UPI003A933E73